MAFKLTAGTAALALALAVLPALVWSQAGGPRPDPAEGRRLAGQWCGQCHAVADDALTAADAGPPFWALANDPATSESALRGFLHEPRPPMPPIDLTKREIDHILAYIVSLKEPKPTGDVDAGRRFVEMHCARCHAIGREGDSPFREAPPFRDLHHRWNTEFLAEALAEGIVVGHPAMPAFELNPREIDDVLAYLATLRRD